MTYQATIRDALDHAYDPPSEAHSALAGLVDRLVDALARAEAAESNAQVFHDEWDKSLARAEKAEAALRKAQFVLKIEGDKCAYDPPRYDETGEGIEIIGETLAEIDRLIGPYVVGSLAGQEGKPDG